jgi:hypothetical protein
MTCGLFFRWEPVFISLRESATKHTDYSVLLLKIPEIEIRKLREVIF